jgi:hypothetical protein
VKVPPAECRRLDDDAAFRKNWKRWGPYLAERQWATVREDYSADGESWTSFPHDHARSRAYRWGEDGLLGICDRQCRLCFAPALWNGRDPILKERLFGLTGLEGNHGEDVKEEYAYLDATPTHSYLKAAYKYPLAAFPYDLLIEENARRGRSEPEYELADTGVFDGDRYFSVVVEYAKADEQDILVRLSVRNMSTESASIHVLPTLWFRNTWSWGCKSEGCTTKPRLAMHDEHWIRADHETLGSHFLWFSQAPGGAIPASLFTENETNFKSLYGVPSASAFTKDAFHEHVVHGRPSAVNPARVGTKAALHYVMELGPGQEAVVRLRLAAGDGPPAALSDMDFDDVLAARLHEADEFYDSVLPASAPAKVRNISRQAYAGLIWTKQFYHYIVQEWRDGDPDMPPPPEARRRGRNTDWPHFFARDILSMPDSWEYPWFAAWDLAFHMLPFARIDPHFAKAQLVLLLREWYMHPSGQIPAYEFALGDANPPVHAWAVWRVYKICGPRGGRDRDFLERCFQKLVINFTWWVNRKDIDGRNLFSGGFLGLDNIGVFDRSKPLPTGGLLQQSDATAWMAFYSLTMMAMAMELIPDQGGLRVAYGDMASKFFEHFIQICDAMNSLGGTGLWDEDDGFYYDQIQIDGGAPIRLKIRSVVGLLPIIAVSALEKDTVDRLPGFKKRFEWFLENNRELAGHISTTRSHHDPSHEHWLLAIPSGARLKRVLAYMLDEAEFLSPFGIRSLSKHHERHPYVFRTDGQVMTVAYTPGESDSGLFGGNSNWRGPIWFPINYLIIEALERYHHHYGDALKVEMPTGSDNLLTLQQVADELSARLVRLFLPDKNGIRPCDEKKCDDGSLGIKDDPLLFHEYFHAETGKGLGASHQTGWTALVARCVENMRALSVNNNDTLHHKED